jgi:hypothetical protein
MYHTTTDGAFVFNCKSTLPPIGSTKALREPPFGDELEAPHIIIVTPVISPIGQ